MERKALEDDIVLKGQISEIVSTELKREDIEQNEKSHVVSPYDQKQLSVISNMELNLTELREYYVISKEQAKNAFNTSLVICILGFIVFIAGIFVTIITQTDIVLYSTIGGGLVEVISGLFFTVHNNSMKQLNVYHKRLGVTEKYLTAIDVLLLPRQDAQQQPNEVAHEQPNETRKADKESPIRMMRIGER